MAVLIYSTGSVAELSQIWLLAVVPFAHLLDVTREDTNVNLLIDQIGCVVRGALVTNFNVDSV